MSLLSVVQVTSYLTKKFAELHSPNKFKVYMGHGGKPWVSDFNHPHYLAGRKALKTGQTSSLGTDAGPLARLLGFCCIVRARGSVAMLSAGVVCRLGRAPCPPWGELLAPGLQGRRSAVEPQPGSPKAHHFFYFILPSVWC